MNYTTAAAEKSTMKITMTFGNDEWTEANNEAYRKNRHKYAVNGFRKGKVPKHILENFYGKGLFYEDALNILLENNYDKVIEAEKENFTIVGHPSFDIGEGCDLEAGNIVIVATVPVRPDVKIEKYTGIKMTRFDYTVTDADVAREIEDVRERVAESVEVTDRPAQLKDAVNIDFAGKVNGEFFEGGTAKGFDLLLGSGQFIPGFEEGVVGMNLGETKDIEVTFPEDYQAEELKGKPAVFTVTLNKITGKKLPELDEAFAKKMGSDSMEAYQAKVRERLEQNAKNRSRNDTENAIITEIAKTATAEIPDAMIEQEEDAAMQKLEYNLMYQGLRLDDYLQYLGTTREEYKKNYEEEARRNALHQLIVEKIIKLENIVATEEEVEEKIAQQAASVGKEAEEYKKTMDPRQRAYIESDLKVTKLFEFLMANNDMQPEAKA
ncbi:MAG: trigger factor [Clostridia bacterium]|nr:trigger factor [Clostridia bacterium]